MVRVDAMWDGRSAGAGRSGRIGRERTSPRFIGILDSLVTLRFEGEPSAAAECRSLMRQGRLRRPFLEEGVPGGGEEVRVAA